MQFISKPVGETPVSWSFFVPKQLGLFPNGILGYRHRFLKSLKNEFLVSEFGFEIK